MPSHKMHLQTHTDGTHTGRQAPSFMNGITTFVNQLVRTALRLVLIAAVAVFLLSLLIATLVVMLTVTVWALVTGRKPDPGKVFGQFRQTSARYTRGAWPPHSGARRRPQDIVDVPAHEIRDAPAAPDSEPGNPPPHDKDPMARMSH